MIFHKQWLSLFFVVAVITLAFSACSKNQKEECISLTEEDISQLELYLQEYANYPTMCFEEDSPYIYYISAYKLTEKNVPELTYDESTHKYCLPLHVIQNYAHEKFYLSEVVNLPKELMEKDGKVYFDKQFIEGFGAPKILSVTVGEDNTVYVDGILVDSEGNQMGNKSSSVKYNKEFLDTLFKNSDFDPEDEKLRVIYPGSKGTFTAVVKCKKEKIGYSWKLCSMK